MLEIDGTETSRGGAGGGDSTTSPESAEWMLLLAWLFGPLPFSGRAPLDRPDPAECAQRSAQPCAGPPELLNVEVINDGTHQ